MISVLMPTFNRSEYLAEAINSVLMQSYKDWELIVVDDGSTDSTPTLMDHYTKLDSRITCIRTSNQGIAKARNTAFQASSGDFIAVMDSDDISAPERLKWSLKTLEKQGVDYVYGGYLQADANGQVFSGVRAPKNPTKEDFRENRAIPHITILAKRKCFEECPYRDELRVNDDTGLLFDWYKAKYTHARVDQPLAIVRYHNNSTSTTKQAEIEKITKQIQKEYDAL